MATNEVQTFEEWFALAFSGVHWITRKNHEYYKNKGLHLETVTHVKSHMSQPHGSFRAWNVKSEF